MQINKQNSNNKPGFSQMRYNALWDRHIESPQAYSALHKAVTETHDFFTTASKNKLVSVSDIKASDNKQYLKITSHNLASNNEHSEKLGEEVIDLEHAKRPDFKEIYKTAVTKVLEQAGVIFKKSDSK
jgi:hypothetical protein